jgi:hypothetical protein
MLNLMSSARLNLPLTPWERAALKLLESCFIAGIVTGLAGLTGVVTLLSGQVVTRAEVTTCVYIVLGSFVSGLLGALGKYLAAQHDPLAGSVLPVIQQAQSTIGRQVATAQAQLPSPTPPATSNLSAATTKVEFAAPVMGDASALAPAASLERNDVVQQPTIVPHG